MQQRACLGTCEKSVRHCRERTTRKNRGEHKNMAGPRTSIRAQPRDALMGDCDAVVEKVVFSLGL
jgi:hypothetical protein